MNRRRYRPSLECLEGRTCPALFRVTYSVGTLILNGSPSAKAASFEDLLIQRVGGFNYQVIDRHNGAAPINYGVFALTRDLRLNLTGFNADINIDLNHGVLPGNIYIDLGYGNNDFAGPFAIPHPVSVYGGVGARVNGSIFVSRGSGQEVVSIGQIGFDTTNPAAEAVVVGNSVYATGGNPSALGNSLFIGPGSVVGNDVIATLYNQITVGAFLAPGAVVGRNLTVNDLRSTVPASVENLGFVGGNVLVYGSATDDQLVIGDPGTGAPGVVGGSLYGYLGNGDDLVNMEPGTVVGKNLYIFEGNGNDTFGAPALAPTPGFSGTVGGVVALTYGNGNNAIAFNNQSYLGSNLFVFVGNGSNAIDLDGLVRGSVLATTGNGTNTFTLDANADIRGPVVSFRGGNGSNTVTVSSPVNTFGLQVIFRSGFRKLDLSAVTSLGAAYIDFGTGFGTKIFVPAPLVTWPQTIKNYP
jgi:hypothetical protein